MRALSSIPVLLSVVFAATACESSQGGFDPEIRAQVLLTPSTATIVSGGALTLHLNAHDENGKTITPSEVTWATSDPRVAIVSADGVVTGRASGASRITAVWHSVQGSSTVTVINGIQSSIPCSTEQFLSAAAADHPAVSIKKATCAVR